MRRTLTVGLFALVVAVAVWCVVTRFPLVQPVSEQPATPGSAMQPSAILALPELGPACGSRCGVERWAVKTLSDVDRGGVSFVPVRATVEELAALPRPAALVPDRRSAPVELTTYEVTGCLAAWSPQADRDIHVVVFGLENQRVSLIGEIPHPACSGVCRSGLGERYLRARFVLDSVLATGKASPQCNNDVPLVTITGVGFFDRAHGQTGAAPNYFEIHPVIAITFP